MMKVNYCLKYKILSNNEVRLTEHPLSWNLTALMKENKYLKVIAEKTY